MHNKEEKEKKKKERMYLDRGKKKERRKINLIP